MGRDTFSDRSPVDLVERMMSTGPLYHYQPDPVRFRSVSVEGDFKDLIYPLHWSNRSAAQEWKPVKVKIEDPEFPEGDFPSLTNLFYVPIFSKRAWNILSPILGSSVECLPLNYPSRDYFLINVMEQLDCLDEKRSDLSRNDASGYVNNIYEYAFREKVIAGKHIFKTPRKSAAKLYVDEGFRRTVESNGLKGLKFKPLKIAR